MNALASVWGQLGASAGAHLVGLGAAALLTLIVLSYAFGSHPLFRLAQYLLVGIAAGYAAALAWTAVLWPRLALLLRQPLAHWPYALFFVLGVMLFARGSRRLSRLADLPLAALIGTGAGLALGGALLGSFLPQVRAAILPVAPGNYGGGANGWGQALSALLLLLATVAVLSAFTYRRNAPTGAWGRVSRWVGGAGRKVLMIAFGALLAGVALSSLTILRERIAFLVSTGMAFFHWTGW